MIGKVVGEIFDNNAPLTNLVGESIFATIMPQKHTPPGVVYQIRTMPYYTKGGRAYNKASVMVLVVAKTYAECLTIVEAVVNALDCTAGTFGNIQITHSRIVSEIDEDYNEELEEHTHLLPFEITYNKVTS